MKARGSGENRVRSNDGLEFFGLKELYAYSLVNGKNAVQIPEAEGKELEDDDDDDELKMMTHAFTRCQDKCAFFLLLFLLLRRLESFHAQIGPANCESKGRR